MMRWKTIMTLVTGVVLAGCTPSSPDNENLHIYIEARSAYLGGDFEDAGILLEAISGQKTLSPQAPFLLAKTRFMQNEFGESRKILEGLINKHPEHADARLWLARASMAEGDIDGAIEIIEKAMMWSSEDPRFLALMGSFREAQGETDLALDYYRRAALFENQMVSIYLSLAGLYGRNRLEDMEAAYLAKAEAIVSEESVFAGALKAARRVGK